MSSHFYPPSRPRPVEGGIKARSTRGDIAQTWWGERFMAVLAESGMGGRLQRGKSYARKGQVISLDLQAGVVNAVVQGSRCVPIGVRIGVTAFGKAEWAAVEQELAGDAWYLARLLAGEMPDDIEQVFARARAPVVPGRGGRYRWTARVPTGACRASTWRPPSTCSPSRSTKTLRILAWRGRTRADLLANLTNAAHSDAGDGAGAGDEPGESPDVPLEDLLDAFFELQGELPRPASPSAAELLAQLPDVRRDGSRAWVGGVVGAPYRTLRAPA